MRKLHFLPIAIFVLLTGLLLFKPSYHQLFAAFSSTPDTGTLSTDGEINAIVSDGSKVYIGGSFSNVGIQADHQTSLATATGIPASGFPSANGTVNVAISDREGGWYIGGDFTEVGSVARNYIAHILSDGSVDPDFDPNADSGVSALVLSSDGSILYAGGGFNNMNGQSSHDVAALNTSDGTLVSGFDANADSSVLSLALSPDESILYVGGAFEHVGGQTRSHIAALFTSNGVASSTFNPGASDSVETLTLSSNGATLYVGGDFDTFGNKTRNYIAAYSITNATTTSFNPDANNEITTLALSSTGSTLYAGGQFSTIGGQTRSSIAALNTSNGTAVSGFDPGAGGVVLALTLSSDDATLYIGGSFEHIGGQDRNRIAAINTSNGTATSFDPSVDDDVNAVALSSDGSQLYAGGSFSLVNTVVRNNIAAFNADGTLDTAFNPDADDEVVGLALSSNGSTLYAGGNFGNIGGQARARIAALTTSNGTAVLSFDPNAGSTVRSLKLSSDGLTLYAGGDFSTIGGQVRNGLAALNTSNGSAISSFNPNADSNVRALALSSNGSTLYAGGNFNNIGGQTRSSIAALNTSNGTATSFNPDANGDSVYTLSLSSTGSTLYAGGQFSTIGGQTRHYIAALNTSNGSAVSSFDPDSNANVYSLALTPDDSTLYAGGNFTNIGGQARDNLAALNTSNGLAVSSFNPTIFTESVRALLLLNDASKLYVGHEDTPYFSSFTCSPTGSCGVASSNSDNNSTPAPSGGGGGIVGSGPLAPSAMSFGYTPPRPQLIYPDGRVEYLDIPASTTNTTSTTGATPKTIPVPHPTFTMYFYLGIRSPQVATLQEYLMQLGFMSTDTPTTYYGMLTQAAIKKFQCATDIVCSGSPASTGWGLVGRKTQAGLNSY